MKKSFLARLIFVIGIAAALAGGALAPVRAQGGLSPEEHDLLKNISATLHDFQSLDSFSTALTMNLQQDINVTMRAQTVQLVQTIEANGTAETQKAVAPNQYDNQHVDLNETVTQTMTGAASRDVKVGPINVEMIVFQDHFYLRLGMPPGQSSALPQGWQDVTRGMDAFPGMGMFNVNSLMEMGGSFQAGYMDALLNAVTKVELTGEEMHAGRKETYYTLTLDPAKAFKGIGSSMFESLFNANAVPFDIGKLIETMFTDPDTTYQIEVVMGAENQMLYEFSVNIHFDIEVTSDMITDPSFQGVTMTMKQTSQQAIMLMGYNEPVTITAPELGQ